MSDIFTKQKRSEIMSKISGKETKPEISVRKFLFANGFRYRKNDKRYPGKPDIVLPKYKTIIFIHGCFWHGHNCRNTKPKDNAEYWQTKIARNQQRDKNVTETLTNKNWKVVRIWECELKDNNMIKDILEAVYA